MGLFKSSIDYSGRNFDFRDDFILFIKEKDSYPYLAIRVFDIENFK